MRQFIGLLIATLMITSSQASTRATSGEHYQEPNLYVAQPRTVTQREPGRVKIPRISKPKIFHSNPYRAVYYTNAANQDDEISIDDDDKISGYRRRDLQKIHNEVADAPDDLSEEIRWKLFLARQLALLKHRETHS